MEELLNRFAEGIAARLGGPLHFRFIIQPLIAIGLGVRDGVHDARLGTPPFFVDLVRRKDGRRESLKGAWRTVRVPILLGAVLDSAAQWQIFHQIRVLPAFLVGAGVIALPYAIARGVTNRIVSGRIQPKSGTP